MSDILIIDEEFRDLLEELKNYDFNIENIVFSGGGIKTTSYLGGVKVKKIVLVIAIHI